MFAKVVRAVQSAAAMSRSVHNCTSAFALRQVRQNSTSNLKKSPFQKAVQDFFNNPENRKLSRVLMYCYGAAVFIGFILTQPKVQSFYPHFFGIPPSCSISEFVKQVESASYPLIYVVQNNALLLYDFASEPRLFAYKASNTHFTAPDEAAFPNMLDQRYQQFSVGVSPELPPISKFYYLPFKHQSQLSQVFDLIQEKTGKKVFTDIDVIYSDANSSGYPNLGMSNHITFFLIILLVPLLLGGLAGRALGGGGSGANFSNIMNNSKNQMQNPLLRNENFGSKHLVGGVAKKSTVKFSDVLGCDEAKLEIREFVEYIKSRDKFKSLNARVPRGALLHGPPGTGKTLLAKALAGETNVSFFSVSGSEFVQMFVGRGAARVRDLFQSAREYAPSIIFIDEIDAIAANRNVNQVSLSEKESTLNQLLTEMDGFKTDENVVVIGGTNRFENLDPAILRAGRFDRHIYVGNPDIAGRKQLFIHYTTPLKYNKSDGSNLINELAEMTAGFSGASISNVCNEAAIYAARDNAELIQKKHFYQAIDRVIAGTESNKVLSKEEKHSVAVHESGHVAVGWFLLGNPEILKATIIPRGEALGYAMYPGVETGSFDEGDKVINNHKKYQWSSFMTEKQFMHSLALTFGGRAAEQVILGRISTGAVDDLQKITNLAYSYVSKYGMSDSLLASYNSLVGYKGESSFGSNKEFNSRAGNEIDKQVKACVEMAYGLAEKVIQENIVKIKKMADYLENKETISKEEIEGFLGKRAKFDLNDGIVKSFEAFEKVK